MDNYQQKKSNKKKSSSGNKKKEEKKKENVDVEDYVFVDKEQQSSKVQAHHDKNIRLLSDDPGRKNIAAKIETTKQDVKTDALGSLTVKDSTIPEVQPFYSSDGAGSSNVEEAKVQQHSEWVDPALHINLSIERAINKAIRHTQERERLAAAFLRNTEAENSLRNKVPAGPLSGLALASAWSTKNTKDFLSNKDGESFWTGNFSASSSSNKAAAGSLSNEAAPAPGSLSKNDNVCSKPKTKKQIANEKWWQEHIKNRPSTIKMHPDEYFKWFVPESQINIFKTDLIKRHYFGKDPNETPGSSSEDEN